jgi:Uma2 family endonuclease
MPVVTPPATEAARLPPGSQYRFTVKQYRQMMETGVLTTNDRTELLEGWIVEKMTHNPPHDAAVDLAQGILRAMLPPAWHLREQKSITTADSEPEPDLAIVRGGARVYARRHPRPSDIAMVIEVADATLWEDRGRKGRIYARARIPVYWIINLVESQVEGYTDPKAGKSPAYQRRQDYGATDRVPIIIAGKEIGRIAVRDLLP